MMSHTFLSLLFPLVISLFYFSTPDNRRKPVFLLNVGAILLAFIVCVLVDASTIHTILHPLNPWHLNTAAQFISVWQSILVDLTLLIRLASVYPLKQIGPKRFALLIAIPILLKLTRAINLILFTKIMVDTLHQPNATPTNTVFVSKPYIKIEWGTQMMDNTYVSLGFLWRIRGQGKGQIMPKARCGNSVPFITSNSRSNVVLTLSTSSNSDPTTAYSLPHLIHELRHTNHILHRTIRICLSWRRHDRPGTTCTRQYDAFNPWCRLRHHMGMQHQSTRNAG
ncbi:hypothetical protein JVU11DRAFT_7189 [Chiua virens]|nr:hypothetical protein JVU11DRAFT_7189 [Chiua virens]